MTIEIHGHVHAIENGGTSRGLRLVIQLEMDRAKGQKLELSVTPEEARNYMPGTGITLRAWPDGRKPSPPEFAPQDREGSMELSAEERAIVEQYLENVICPECHVNKAYHRPGCSLARQEPT
jgi:hypothetical protein